MTGKQIEAMLWQIGSLGGLAVRELRQRSGFPPGDAGRFTIGERL
jgi:hypothetical protein